MRGSNKLVLEEAARSLHDALCVIRCLVQQKALIAGGGAPEIELSIKLGAHAQSLSGVDAYCVKAYANAFEVSQYFYSTFQSLLEQAFEFRYLITLDYSVDAGRKCRVKSYRDCNRASKPTR